MVGWVVVVVVEEETILLWRSDAAPARICSVRL